MVSIILVLERTTTQARLPPPFVRFSHVSTEDGSVVPCTALPKKAGGRWLVKLCYPNTSRYMKTINCPLGSGVNRILQFIVYHIIVFHTPEL